MTQIQVFLTGAQARAEKTGPLTGGMTGVRVTFLTDESWEELGKTPVFRAGDVTRDAVLTENTATVPAQVLEQTGQVLMVGLQGTSRDGTVVIPTTWARVGLILEGARACGEVDPKPEESGKEWEALLTGTVEEITIPSEVEQLRTGAFYGCDKLKTIHVAGDHPTLLVEDGVLYSKDGTALLAFPGGKQVEVFTIPEHVSEVKEAAFGGCAGIGRIEIGSNVQHLAVDAFAGLAGADILLRMDGELLSAGGAYPVGSGKINAVVIPEDATYLSLDAFRNLPGIKTVYIYGKCTYEQYRAYDSASKAYLYYNAYSMGGIQPTGFVIGGAVDVVDYYLVNGCSEVRWIQLEEGVNGIDSNAFTTLTNLEILTVPASVAYIGVGAISSANVLIRGYAGSYAQEWAALNNYSFEVIE